MGNQVNNGDGRYPCQDPLEEGYSRGESKELAGTYTPKKKNTSNLFSNLFRESNQDQDLINCHENFTKKSNSKEGLYAEDKIFENYENTSIFGFRLDTDPEDREFYLNCPFCSKLNLDSGLTKTIICKTCKKEFDIDEAQSNIGDNAENSSKMENLIINCNKNSKKKISLNLNLLKSPLRQKKAKKIQELSSLVVFVNKDSLFETFLNEENLINYDLLIKKILLPYFKIKSRIMKKCQLFKIGEIGFKVFGLSPFKKGVISSKTYIHCDNFFSLSTPIKRALMITTSKYDNFNQESLKKEILTQGENLNLNLLINKNEVFQIRQMEFIIRNCDPQTGVLNNESQITIENKDIMNISKVKIAIIKNNVPQFQTPIERRDYEDYILKEYFRPYFLSGVKKYIERGDVFAIEDLEMFILNSYPDNGFISGDTQVMFKLGMNKEKCLEKINSADDKYAFSLMNYEENTRHGHENILSISRHTSDNQINLGQFRIRSAPRLRSFDEIIFRNLVTANRLNFEDENLDSIISSGNFFNQRNQDTIRHLPTLIVTENYLKNLEIKSEEEAMKKCVICMEKFEIKEVLKTLPCFHIFHCSCIDEWLGGNSQCPICKSEVVE